MENFSIHPNSRATRRERLRKARENFRNRPGQFNPDAPQNGHPRQKNLDARRRSFDEIAVQRRGSYVSPGRIKTNHGKAAGAMYSRPGSYNK